MTFIPSRIICTDKEDIEVARTKFLAWSGGKDYNCKFITIEEAKEQNVELPTKMFNNGNPNQLSTKAEKLILGKTEEKIITYTLLMDEETGPTTDDLDSIIDILREEIKEYKACGDELPVEFTVKIRKEMTHDELNAIGELDGW